MLVPSPLAAIGEDEDGFDFVVGEVAGAGVLQFRGGQLTEWCGVLIVFDDITGGDDVLEAVAFGDMSAFLAFTANDQHGSILGGHFSHGRVTANELARADFEF